MTNVHVARCQYRAADTTEQIKSSLTNTDPNEAWCTFSGLIRLCGRLRAKAVLLVDGTKNKRESGVIRTNVPPGETTSLLMLILSQSRMPSLPTGRYGMWYTGFVKPERHEHQGSKRIT